MWLVLKYKEEFGTAHNKKLIISFIQLSIEISHVCNAKWDCDMKSLKLNDFP